MRDLELGRVIRALRHRRGWRQTDAAGRARVHRSTWSRLERGQLDGMSVGAVRSCLAGLGVRLEMLPRLRGAELDRLIDEAHAGLQSTWAARLARWQWTVRVEASFSHFGERGRVDLLAWHQPTGALVIGEMKTDLGNAQETLGRLDTKVRLAGVIAREAGLPGPTFVVPLLVFAESMTVRRRVARIEPLFARYALRGKPAITWLRHPVGRPSGMLIFSGTPAARARGVGRERIRRSGVS